MTEEEKKALLKNDMITAMEFNRVLDLKDKTQLGHLKILLERKNYFNTNFSVIYLNRVNDILNDNSPDTCIKCKNQGTYDGFWCKGCITKITGRTFEEDKNVAIAKANEKAAEKKTIHLPELKLVILGLSALVLVVIMLCLGIGFSRTNRIIDINEAEVIDVDIKKDSPDEPEVETVKPEKKSLRNKDVEIEVEKNIIEGDYQITNEDEALNLVKSLFTPSEDEIYEFVFSGDAQSSRINFMVDVGHRISESASVAEAYEGNEDLYEMVDCWQINVIVKKGNMVGDCNFIVDEQGRILQEGVFGIPDNYEMIRIR